MPWVLSALSFLPRMASLCMLFLCPSSCQWATSLSNFYNLLYLTKVNLRKICVVKVGVRHILECSGLAPGSAHASLTPVSAQWKKICSIGVIKHHLIFYKASTIPWLSLQKILNTTIQFFEVYADLIIQRLIIFLNE